MLNNAKTLLLIFVFFLSTGSISRAQKFYFEPVISAAATDYVGSNIIADSIRVVANWDDRAGIKEIRAIGVNFGYNLTPRLDFLTNLSFSKINPSYEVYNELSTCTFCPIKKGGGQVFRDIQLSLRPRFAFITSKKIRIIGFIETSIHFTVNINNDYVPIEDFNGKLPTVAKVLNSIAATPGKTFFAYGYGGTFYYKE